ncbi:protein kinase domain-containing protein [Tautonia rosea]|uniref:protein kinase domain-containing protein n=1 Tax=Tautonia rosea TaxID=2728037 RepID=UPI001473ABB3|nr:protein kinase [Tautonia rosea]
MTPREDPSPVDPRILAALLAEDAAMARSGRLDDATGGQEYGDLSTLEEDLAALEEIDALLRCLSLVEQVWPRGDRDRDRDRDDEGQGGENAPAVPRTIGRFAIRGEVGRGGFGIVFEAFDSRIGRAVALKVPAIAALGLPEPRQRFLREARAAGGLDHPNIVPVFEAGRAGSSCYIASALCRGPNLSAWLQSRDGPITPRKAAAIALALADAVQHAHERGILHRDLKPSNVLLWPEASGDGVAGLGFVPKLTDFGLARIVEEAGDETGSGVPIGSPPYMAPEQAAGRNREVGPASDVYGLGAILYELLTGRPPFRGESNPETIRMVLEQEVVAPRSLRPGLPKDLETITLACLAKEPWRRYASAAALADDLRRFLDGRPILARRASVPERAWKATRRHPWRAAAIGLLVAAIVGVSASNSRLRAERDRADRNSVEAQDNAAESLRNAERARLAAAEADAQRIEADAQRRLARRHLLAALLRQTRDALGQEQTERAQEILDEVAAVGGPTSEPGFDFVANYLAHTARREFEVFRGHDADLASLSIDADGRIVTIDRQGVLITRDPIAGRSTGRTMFDIGRWLFTTPIPIGHGLLAIREGVEPVGGNLLHFYPLGFYEIATGRRVARLDARDGQFITNVLPLCGGERLLVVSVDEGWKPSALVLGLDPDGAEPLVEIADLGPIEGLGTAPDIDRYVILTDGLLRTHDARTDAILREVAVAHGGTRVYRLDLSPDGRLALIGALDAPNLLVETETGAIVGEFPIQEVADPVRFDPSGRTLAVVDHPTGRVFLWDRPDGEPRLRVLLDPEPSDTPYLFPLAFSPDGSRIALAPREGQGAFSRLEIREVATGEVVATFPGGPVRSDFLTFAPDGRSLLFQAGRDLIRWHFDPPPEAPGPAGHEDEAWAVAFSPDGRWLATGADEPDDPRPLRLWEVATGHEALGWKAHPSTVSALAFSPDSRLLASSALREDANLRVWEAATGRLVADVPGHSAKVRTVGFSPDGRLLISASDDGTARVWDTSTWACRLVLEGQATPGRVIAAVLPDGETIATASLDRRLRLWNADEGRELRSIELPFEPLAMATSPDGSTLAVASNDGHLLLVDPSTGELVRTIRDLDGELRAVAFSPDGSLVAAAGSARTVRLWDPVTGQSLLTLDGPRDQINGLAFSPDGSSLTCTVHDGSVFLWRTEGPGGTTP